MITLERPFRALIADDDNFVRAAAMRALSQEGFVCETAENGKQAIEKCSDQAFDLVVSDLQMPEVNGHKFIVELLAAADHPAIIVLTGLPEPKLTRDLLRRGVDDVIAKPANFDLLVAKAKSLVERKRSEMLAMQRKEVAKTDSPQAAIADRPAPNAARHATPLVVISAAANDCNISQDKPGVPTNLDESRTDGAKACDELKSAGDSEFAGGRNRLQLADQLKTACRALEVPPADFDMFREVNSCAFTLKELLASLRSSPNLAADALQLANSISYQAQIGNARMPLIVERETQSTVTHRVLVSMCLMALVLGIIIGGLSAACAFSWSNST